MTTAADYALEYISTKFEVIKERKVVFAGNADQVREWVEDKLAEKVGMFVMLQNDIEDEDDFQIYLHSDNDEDLSDENLEELDTHHGLNTHDLESVDFAIKQLLGIEIKEAAQS